MVKRTSRCPRCRCAAEASALTWIPITDADRRQQAEVRAERMADSKVHMALARWLHETTGQEGVYLPTLSPETVERLLPLLLEHD